MFTVTPRGHERHAGPDGESGGMRRKVRFVGCYLAEEQAESRDGESYAHQAQPGTNPGQEGALGSQVNAGISFCVIRHFLKYTPSVFQSRTSLKSSAW